MLYTHTGGQSVRIGVLSAAARCGVDTESDVAEMQSNEGRLGPVRSVLSPLGVVEHLDGVARRGRLAGFERGGPGGALFCVGAHGSPFEGEVVAHGREGDGGTELTFSWRLKRAWPVGFAVFLVLSVWPGLPLTQSLLASVVPSWHWLWESMAWWYLPLSIVGGAWGMWTAVRSSQREVAASAAEMVGKIERELSGVPASVK